MRKEERRTTCGGKGGGGGKSYSHLHGKKNPPPLGEVRWGLLYLRKAVDAIEEIGVAQKGWEVEALKEKNRGVQREEPRDS